MAVESTKLTSSFLFSFVLHVSVVVVMLGLPTDFLDKDPSVEVRVIQSTLLDERQVKKEIERIRRNKNRQERQKQNRLQALDRAAREAERKRQAEERRLAEMEKQKIQQAKQALQDEKEAKQRLEDLQHQLDKKKQAAAKQAALDEKRKAAAAKKKRLQKQADDNLLAMLDKESADIERDQIHRALSSELEIMRAKWTREIKNKVLRNWAPPPNLPPDYYCTVRIKQIRGGLVVESDFKGCKTGRLSKAMTDSMEKAGRKASPLPRPEEPELFDAIINVIFKPPDKS